MNAVVHAKHGTTRVRDSQRRTADKTLRQEFVSGALRTVRPIPFGNRTHSPTTYRSATSSMVSATRANRSSIWAGVMGSGGARAMMSPVTRMNAPF